MCLGVGLFASNLFRTLCASWTCTSISFAKLGKVSFLIFSNRFLFFCPFSSPSDSPMMWMLYLLKLSQRLLTLLSFFWILFSCCSVCLFFFFFLLPYVSNHWSDSWLHPAYCCFPVNCSLFQVVFILRFWLDLLYTIEVLTKFLEHPYNQCFELCIW